MPNFLVFSSTPSSLLAQVSQPTAASLLMQPVNLTAASLLMQPVNLTAASLLMQPVNLTAASLLMQPVNLTAASLLIQPVNLTAASLLVQSTLEDRRVADSLVNIPDTGGTTFTTATVENVLEFSMFTFTVQNTGTSNSALARLQLSADSQMFTTDPAVASETIVPSSQYFFVPSKFTKYASIQYASQTASLSTSLSIFFQAAV